MIHPSTLNLDKASAILLDMTKKPFLFAFAICVLPGIAMADAPVSQPKPQWCAQASYVRRMQGGVLTDRQLARCAVVVARKAPR